jgi:hypothetical protein
MSVGVSLLSGVLYSHQVQLLPPKSGPAAKGDGSQLVPNKDKERGKKKSAVKEKESKGKKEEDLEELLAEFKEEANGEDAEVRPMVRRRY